MPLMSKRSSSVTSCLLGKLSLLQFIPQLRLIFSFLVLARTPPDSAPSVLALANLPSALLSTRSALLA